MLANGVSRSDAPHVAMRGERAIVAATTHHAVPLTATRGAAPAAAAPRAVLVGGRPSAGILRFMATCGASERKTPFASNNGVPAHAEGQRGCAGPRVTPAGQASFWSVSAVTDGAGRAETVVTSSG